MALSGGEDYELLFAAGPRTPSADVLSRQLGQPVTEIGVLRRGRGVRLTRGGRRVSTPEGFDHFKTRSGPTEE